MIDNQENTELEQDFEFLILLKKSLSTLENLIKNENIEIPVSQETLMDISIGALAESQANNEIDIVTIFSEQKEFLFDTLLFEEGGEYNLHDVLAQVICFRLIGLMEEYLEHMEIGFDKSIYDSDDE